MGNKPLLRFKGFTDDWEERKLEDASEIIDGDRGKNYPSGDDFKSSGHTLFLSATNVTKQGFVFKENQYITNLKSELLGNGKVNLNDIILTSRGSIGHIGLYDERINENIPHARINSGMLILRTNKFNSPSFIAQFLKASLGIKQIKLISFGSAQPQLTKKDIKKFKITLPKIEEQIKIGAFLKQLDDTIALHQRKLNLLKEQKKGFLQKMFPKNDAKVPEFRFEGFTDDWEERKLGELSKIVGGGTPSTSNPEYWDGDIDWYAPAEIGEQSYVSKSKKTITELGLKKSSARILPVGTVLFTSRAGIGNTAILGKEATTNQGFQSIVPDQNKLDSYFIYSRTNELKRYGEVTGAGSTFVEVSGKQMSKMSIMVPELSEQQQIGSFFKQLDNTIALHQRKLNLLKEQKKGFLQKMFV
ncbi:restriction endonuclease subunit S [Leuconostoc citreum]|uniref:Restriction endonuclease subunit S n=1 Tax=Leuconostoc citreum TaxID=33964 RepID=A0A5A5U0Q3_LEUCI|nr:restriction endonuclease subunit S [Leuconostoc citreum]GDZ84661.1 restriction endonuclease subunit S [Leuconostoc citreum]